MLGSATCVGSAIGFMVGSADGYMSVPGQQLYANLNMPFWSWALKEVIAYLTPHCIRCLSR